MMTKVTRNNYILNASDLEKWNSEIEEQVEAEKLKSVLERIDDELTIAEENWEMEFIVARMSGGIPDDLYDLPCKVELDVGDVRKLHKAAIQMYEIQELLQQNQEG